ncbi:hypothetical protein [Streptomyces sp. NPDC002611]
MTTTATYETHQRRAVEPDGTVHAARYAGDRDHFTTACACYPAPEIERLEAESFRSVTCPGCLQALAVVITCPICRAVGAEEFALPIPGTDDFADCVRCTGCGHTWCLDAGANTGCTSCGGSGRLGNGSLTGPRCPCHEDSRHT